MSRLQQGHPEESALSGFFSILFILKHYLCILFKEKFTSEAVSMW